MIIRRLRLYHLLGVCLSLLTLFALRSEAWPLGSTPVTVVNPSDIAKAEGIQHPFQRHVACAFNGSISCGGDFTAPTSQRLVIEYVSGNCGGLEGGNALASVSLQTTAEGDTELHDLAILDHFGVNILTGQLIVFGQVTRIYADPGSEIQLAALMATSSNTGVCHFIFSGQAIDVP